MHCHGTDPWRNDSEKVGLSFRKKIEGDDFLSAKTDGRRVKDKRRRYL